MGVDWLGLVFPSLVVFIQPIVQSKDRTRTNQTTFRQPIIKIPEKIPYKVGVQLFYFSCCQLCRDGVKKNDQLTELSATLHLWWIGIQVHWYAHYRYSHDKIPCPVIAGACRSFPSCEQRVWNVGLGDTKDASPPIQPSHTTTNTLDFHFRAF